MQKYSVYATVYTLYLSTALIHVNSYSIFLIITLIQLKFWTITFKIANCFVKICFVKTVLTLIRYNWCFSLIRSVPPVVSICLYICFFDRFCSASGKMEYFINFELLMVLTFQIGNSKYVVGLAC